MDVRRRVRSVIRIFLTQVPADRLTIDRLTIGLRVIGMTHEPTRSFQWLVEGFAAKVGNCGYEFCDRIGFDTDGLFAVARGGSVVCPPRPGMHFKYYVQQPVVQGRIPVLATLTDLYRIQRIAGGDNVWGDLLWRWRTVEGGDMQLRESHARAVAVTDVAMPDVCRTRASRCDGARTPVGIHTSGRSILRQA